MKKTLVIAVLALSVFAGVTQAQECSAWGFKYDGGVDQDAPEAFSPCDAPSTVAVLCRGSALMVNFRPDRNLDGGERYSGAYYQIVYEISGFTYSDYAEFNSETEEYTVMRHAWESQHPLFEALQSGSQVEVSLPTREVQATISLAGPKEALLQVTESCMEN